MRDPIEARVASLERRADASNGAHRKTHAALIAVLEGQRDHSEMLGALMRSTARLEQRLQTAPPPTSPSAQAPSVTDRGSSPTLDEGRIKADISSAIRELRADLAEKELARVDAKARELEAARTDWMRWAVRGAVGLVVAIGCGVVGFLAARAW